MKYTFQISDRLRYHTLQRSELWIENIQVLEGDHLAGYRATAYPPEGTPPEVADYLQMLLDDFSLTEPDPAGALFDYLNEEPQPIDIKP